jgi:hypothetical protein
MHLSSKFVSRPYTFFKSRGMDIMNQYQQQKQRERNMEEQGTVLVAIVIGFFMIAMTPTILILLLAVGQVVGLIVGAVMLPGVLAVVGLSFMLSKSYWKKVEAEKERTNALKDLPSEPDLPSSENF